MQTNTSPPRLAPQAPAPLCEPRSRFSSDPAALHKAVHEDRRAGSIRHWPAPERPRERLHAAGVGALSDGELLALFIRTGVKGSSAVDIARIMLKRFGSLTELLGASNAELQQIGGLGPAKAAQLQAINELARRSLAARMRFDPALDSPTAIGDYLRLTIGSRPYEVFITLYLDVKYRLIRVDESSRGTLTHTHVYPREIVRQALALNAAAVVVAHNHPSGEAHPSDADHFLTKRLKSSMALVDITLLDHFVVSADAHWSYSEHGLL